MGTKRWYVNHAKGRSRPLSSTQLRKLATTRAIGPKTPVQLVGSGQWVTASQIKGLFDNIDIENHTDINATVPIEPTSQQSPTKNHDPVQSSPFLRSYLAVVLIITICLTFFAAGVFVDDLKNKTPSQEDPTSPTAETLVASEETGDFGNAVAVEDSEQQVATEIVPENMALDSPQPSTEAEFSSEVDSIPQLVPAESVNSLSVKEIAKLLKESTVTVQVTHSGGESLGSGFFIEDGRTLITCLHVVKGARTIVAELPSGKKAQCLVYQAFSEPWDLVILRTSEPLGAIPLPLASITPEQGESIFAYGAPKGFAGTLSSGLVSAVRSDDLFSLQSNSLIRNGTKLIQFTAAISPGSSGGPVVDGRGCVVGIAASQWTSADDINFAIDVSHLVSLLQQARQGREALLVGLPERPKEPEELKKDEMTSIAKDFLSEMKKRRAEAENFRKSHEAIADLQQKARERELRLAQLQARISEGNLYLRQLESEETALLSRYREVESAGRAVWESGMQLENQVETTNAYISGVERELLMRQEAARQGKEYRGDPRSNAALAQDLQRLRDNLVRQEAEARRLEAKYLGLDQEARTLKQQHAAKQQDYWEGRDLRDYLMDEQEAMQAQAP